MLTIYLTPHLTSLFVPGITDHFNQHYLLVQNDDNRALNARKI